MTTDATLSRLRWKCRRGMRELDLLLLAFLERGYGALDAGGRTCFERLVDYPDPVLLELLMGRMTPSDKDVAQLVERIRACAAG